MVGRRKRAAERKRRTGGGGYRSSSRRRLLETAATLFPPTSFSFPVVLVRHVTGGGGDSGGWLGSGTENWFNRSDLSFGLNPVTSSQRLRIRVRDSVWCLVRHTTPSKPVKRGQTFNGSVSGFTQFRFRV
ncbi:hypothetical protein Hdeb2414_s0017g00505081 [Helianthus debilis subsp. tardiflorus]